MSTYIGVGTDRGSAVEVQPSRNSRRGSAVEVSRRGSAVEVSRRGQPSRSAVEVNQTINRATTRDCVLTI
jgi:hypothetical protein